MIGLNYIKVIQAIILIKCAKMMFSLKKGEDLDNPCCTTFVRSLLLIYAKLKKSGYPGNCKSIMKEIMCLPLDYRDRTFKTLKAELCPFN